MYNRAYGSNFSGGIWNGIKNSFKQGTALTRLIYINIGVFLIIKILEVFFVLAGQRGFEQLLLPYVGVPALPERLLYTPWTIITNMFTQFGFLHLLFNMLWLYWFGSLFLQPETHGSVSPWGNYWGYHLHGSLRLVSRFRV